MSETQTTRYRPTETECRCLLCGDMLAVPALWFDTVPPDRHCREGAAVVTACKDAMTRAQETAWLVKTVAEQKATMARAETVLSAAEGGGPGTCRLKRP